jgi:hypothetical protein
MRSFFIIWRFPFPDVGVSEVGLSVGVSAGGKGPGLGPIGGIVGGPFGGRGPGAGRLGAGVGEEEIVGACMEFPSFPCQ